MATVCIVCFTPNVCDEHGSLLQWQQGTTTPYQDAMMEALRVASTGKSLTANVCSLVGALVSGDPVALTTPEGMKRYVRLGSLEREDGSGRCWNVRTAEGERLFVRTPDPTR